MRTKSETRLRSLFAFLFFPFFVSVYFCFKLNFNFYYPTQICYKLIRPQEIESQNNGGDLVSLKNTSMDPTLPNQIPLYSCNHNENKFTS